MPDIQLPVRPGGFEQAWGKAQHRRRIQAGAGGGAAASLVLVVLLFPHGVGLDSLRQDPNPPAVLAGSPSPSTPATESPMPTGSPTATIPSPLPGGVAAPSSTPEPSPSSAEPLEPAKPTRSYPITRDETAYDGSTAKCATSDTYGVAQGWCAQLPGPFVAKSGSTQVYRVQICRLPNFPTVKLRFYGDQAAFDVVRDLRPEWSADQHPQDHAVTTVQVAATRCARWSVEWDTRDGNGDLLPASSAYTLDASIYTAAGVAGTDPNSYGVIAFSQQFTITR